MAKIHLQVLDEAFDITVSPSFLSEAECPAAVRYSRIDKKPRRSDLPLEVGRSTHGIFERVVKLRLAGKPVDDDALAQIFKEAVTVGAVSELGEIRRMTNLFLQNFYPPLDSIVGVEEELTLDAGGNLVHSWDEAAYGGYLDLVQIRGRTLRVTDYKNQHNILSKDELDAHRQGTFYLMLARKIYPQIETFEFAIYYARHGFMHVTERSHEQLDAMEQEVSIRLHAISKWEDWLPIPGEHCTICDARFECPKGQDMSPVPDTIITEDQARQAAGRLRVTEIMVKELKKRLRAYSGENGEVAAGPTFRYGFVPGIKTSYPTGPVTDKLKEHKIDPDPFLRIDSTAFKKAMKGVQRNAPDVYSDISSAFVTEGKTTFKGFRPGSGGDEDDED
jgi:hypothetical protein